MARYHKINAILNKYIIAKYQMIGAMISLEMVIKATFNKEKSRQWTDFWAGSQQIQKPATKLEK